MKRTNPTDEQKRLINVQGTFNFRDLGGYETVDGYQVKWGKLYRSGNLSLLKDRDIQTINELGIKKICDLRDEKEITKFPDPPIEGVSWLHTPIVSDPRVVKQVSDLPKTTQSFDYSIPGHYLLSLNRKMVSFSSSFQQVFKALLDGPEQPLLFHCMAGKDRTGAVGALILSILGVPREIIYEDYLITNLSLEQMKAHFEEIGLGSKRAKEVDQALIDAMFEARLEYIESFFDELESLYGNVEVYVKGAIGLSEQDIETLRKHLLE